jgi:ketosteroid isomerase-like protein
MNADQQQIAEAVRAVFRAGEARDFSRLRSFHAEEPAFSRWSNRPGGELLDIAAAHEEEEAAFGALAPDTRVAPEQIRVDLFGDVAVSTFLVHVGSPEGAVLRRTRGTLVWHRVPDGWRIVHEHFSP